MNRLVLCFAAACLAFAQTPPAQFPKAPTIDQALGMKAPGSPQISPDGLWVAYTLSETDWDDNEFKSQLWLARADGSERFQLTRGKKSASNPLWSPDGKWLAFTTDRDSKRQVWLISPRGGEAWPLTSDESGVGSFDWSPNSKRIAFTSDGPESKARKERKDKYGEFSIIGDDYTFSHLYVLDVPTEAGAKPKAEQITSGESFTVQGFHWSPDSSRIAFAATVNPDLGSGDTSDIYTVTLADKAVRKIVSTPGPDNNPVWSPDGAQIAYSTANAEPYNYFKNSRIAVVPAAGGTPRVLTLNFDEEPDLSGWSREGIWFGALQKTSAALFLLDPSTGNSRRVLGGDGLAILGGSFTRDFKTAALLAFKPNEYPEVYVTPVASPSPRAITDNRAQYAQFTPADREVISWKSRDGAVIEGVLIKPAGFQAGRRYPLLVVIHGGPTGIDRPMRAPDRTYPVELFAAKGAIILRPNYRGSAGYGEAFRSLNVRNLGVGDMWDVESGVDYLIQQGIADPDKVGAMGWSQGGYISAFLSTNSKKFKALSVGAGISDWMTYYVNTDIHPFTRQYLKATPWDDPAIYAKTSPITNIKRAATPTLIQHGENDRRVPLPNAFELYQGLRDVGVETRLVVYKGFGHGITKPKQQRHVLEDNLAWFTRWIWGEK